MRYINQPAWLQRPTECPQFPSVPLKRSPEHAISQGTNRLRPTQSRDTVYDFPSCLILITQLLFISLAKRIYPWGKSNRTKQLDGLRESAKKTFFFETLAIINQKLIFSSICNTRRIINSIKQLAETFFLLPFVANVP